jgi:hypothetical protein
MRDWVMEYVLVMPYDAWEPEYGDCEKYHTIFFETPEKAMKYLHDNIYDASNEYPLRYETWKEWAKNQDIYLYERCAV